MMKVLAINTSIRRQSNSYKWLRYLLNKLDLPYQLIFLPTAINQCVNCTSDVDAFCTGGCKLFRDLDEIMEKILSADIVIIACPTYWWGIPGNVKSFLDRLSPLKDYDLKDKKIISLAVASEEGSHQAALQIVAVFNDLGFTIPPHGILYSNKPMIKDDLMMDEINKLVRALR